MKLTSLLTTLLLVLALCIVAPGSAQDKGTKEKPWVIGMSQCNLGEPWRVQMNADVKAAAEKQDNVQVIYKDAQNDTLKQRAHIEEFISSGVDLIIVSPKEAVPLTPPIKRAFDDGIPVIVLDRRIAGEAYTQFIGADNKLIGEHAGDWIVKELGGKGNVVELKGLMTSTPGQDRHSGFRSALKKTPDLKIVFEADMQWLEPNARKEMESALARFDKIDLVYAHNDPAAHGAWLAAKAAGREKDIKFVGIDGLPHEGQMYVKQGVLAACFEYPTGGKEAVENGLKILGGEKLPKEVTLESRVFTPDNIEKGGEWLKKKDEKKDPVDAAKEAVKDAKMEIKDVKQDAKDAVNKAKEAAPASRPKVPRKTVAPPALQ